MNIDAFYYLEKIRKIVRPLPGVEEYTCFGTPAFRVKKKLLARLREDGETLAVHCDNRDKWMEANSEVFFITDHYRNYRFVLVKLAMVNDDDLEQLLLDAWKQVATKTLLKQFAG